jgi:hypothetical protein
MIQKKRSASCKTIPAAPIITDARQAMAEIIPFLHDQTVLDFALRFAMGEDFSPEYKYNLPYPAKYPILRLPRYVQFRQDKPPCRVLRGIYECGYDGSPNYQLHPESAKALCRSIGKLRSAAQNEVAQAKKLQKNSASS